jgi:hypothetical protein
VITLSYRNGYRLLRWLPICPKPVAIGLSNIPRDEALLFAYNHQTARAEPLFLAMAAPPRLQIRFFADVKVAKPSIVAETLKDVRNSLFSAGVQKKWSRHPLRRKMMGWVSRFMTRFLTANISRFNAIPVYIREPSTPEEEAMRRKTNREAFEDCIQSLENNIPVALAPSGGFTHQDAMRSTVPTILPSLAEVLQRRGKTLKIVPSVIKERPQVAHGTYKLYIADRILPWRLFRLLLDRLKIKRYVRPRLTVEFLPPVTFPHVDSSKEDKVRFVQELQQMMYDVLNRD